MSLLDVRGLGISFRSKTRSTDVVTSLDFSINPGSVFGLAGESGCGKSLTALSILRILPQGAHASGEIIFKNQNILKLSEKSMRNIRGKDISMVFQEPMTSLNPVLTIGYQISEVLETHLGLDRKESTKRAVDLLRSVRIPSPEHRIKEYPHQLSGGMRQRVMIAMAIACNPSLLIADEPTTALDVTIEAQILDLLQGLRKERNMAVLLITHDIGIIAENAERVAIMYAGRIVETSETANVLSRPRHPYTMGLLESLPMARGVALKPIPGSVPRPGELPPGCKFSDRCRYSSEECTVEEPLLREIVAGHFARCIKAEEIEWAS